MQFLRTLLRRENRDEFAHLAIRELRRASLLSKGETPEYLPDEFAIKIGQALIFLQNVYADYQETPFLQRLHTLRDFLDRVIIKEEAPPDLLSAAPRLTLRVRSRGFWAFLELRNRLGQGGGLKPPCYTRDLGEHHTLEVVYDGERTVESINDPLTGENVDSDTVFAIALANLGRASDQPFEEVVPGVWSASVEDFHDGARFMLTEQVNALSLKGRPMAFIPESKHLLLTGSEDEAGIRYVHAVMLDFMRESTRWCTGHPLLLDADTGTWRSPQLEELQTTAIRALIKELITYSFARDYEEQAELLERLQMKGTEPGIYFVADYNIQQDSEGGIQSLVVWGPVASLLPYAEQLAVLVFEGDVPIVCRWHEARRLVEEHFGAGYEFRDDLYPPRLAVSEPPRKFRPKLAAIAINRHKIPNPDEIPPAPD